MYLYFVQRRFHTPANYKWHQKLPYQKKRVVSETSIAYLLGNKEAKSVKILRVWNSFSTAQEQKSPTITANEC
jgi:hypothetical protein